MSTSDYVKQALRSVGVNANIVGLGRVEGNNHSTFQVTSQREMTKEEAMKMSAAWTKAFKSSKKFQFVNNQKFSYTDGKFRAMVQVMVPKSVWNQAAAKAIVASSQDVKKFVDSSEYVRELSSFINNEPSRKYLRLTFSLWKKESKSKTLPTKPGFKKLWSQLGEALEGAVNVGNEDGWEYDEDVQALDHLYDVIAMAR